MRPCAQRGKNRWASPQYTPDDDQPVARRRGGARHCLMGVTPLSGMAMEWHPGDRLRTCHRAAWPDVMSRMMSCNTIGGHPRGFGPARPAHTSRTGSRFLDQTSPWPPLPTSSLHWGVIGSSQCGGGVAWPIVRGRVAQCGDSHPLMIHWGVHTIVPARRGGGREEDSPTLRVPRPHITARVRLRPASDPATL